MFLALNLLCSQTFGDPVSYTPVSTGVAVSLQAILDRSSDEEQLSDGVYARLFFNFADLTLPPVKGDHVVAEGDTWTVYEVLKDSGDGSYLRLRQ